MKLALTLILLLQPLWINGDEQVSDNLAIKQKEIEDKLDAQLKVIQAQIDHIDWYFKVGYNNQEKPMMDDVEEFVSNPINTFTMIKRTSLYWPGLKKHLFNQTIINDWEQLAQDIDDLNNALTNQNEIKS